MTQQFRSQVYTQKNWKHVHKIACVQKFTVALFIIAQSGNNPLTDEWIKNVIYPYNEILSGNTNEWITDMCYNTIKL